MLCNIWKFNILLYININIYILATWILYKKIH